MRLKGFNTAKDDFGNCEQTDQQRQDMHTRLKVMDAKSKPTGAMYRILANHGDQETKRGSDQPFKQRVARNTSNDRYRKDNYSKDLRRAKFQRKGRDNRKNHQGHNRRQHARDKRGIERHL